MRLLGQSDQKHGVGKRVWQKGLEDQAEAQMGQFQATAAEPCEGQGQGVDSTLLSYIMYIIIREIPPPSIRYYVRLNIEHPLI